MSLWHEKGSLKRRPYAKKIHLFGISKGSRANIPLSLLNKRAPSDSLTRSGSLWLEVFSECRAQTEPGLRESYAGCGYTEQGEIKQWLSLVQLLHYCALIGRELHSDAMNNQLKAPKDPLVGLGVFLALRWFFMA